MDGQHLARQYKEADGPRLRHSRDHPHRRLVCTFLLDTEVFYADRQAYARAFALALGTSNFLGQARGMHERTTALRGLIEAEIE